MNHIGLEKLDTPFAIITGDPDRVPIISKLLSSNCYKLKNNRGFLSYHCEFKNTKVLVINSGIGSPSTAIVIEKLIELGVGLIIRLGTCGAIQKNIHIGDLVIPTGAVRDEGTSMQYIDIKYPAVPDFNILSSLIFYTKLLNIPYHIGLVHSKDAYYLEKPEKQLDQNKTKLMWNNLYKFGVLATEMESSILFILSSVRQIQSASILINVGKTPNNEVFNKSLQNAVNILKRSISTIHDQDY